ncbi:MAG TPA: hypothetical protein DCF89_07920 [Flavobacteriales bacterium]|nr:hypothetical protein [Flavobacteriales bacterium]
MDLSGIISISGKPGLYKVVANNRSNLVVESLVDSKRFTALASHRISALEDISIYTEEDDVPLKEVYEAIFSKESGGPAPNHKEDMNLLRSYLGEVLPNYDEERVYGSDIKKLFQWYNVLQSSGALIEMSDTDSDSETEEE